MNRIIFGTSIILSIIILVVIIGGGWFGSATIPDEASAGYTVWESYDCGSCHALIGQGSNFAPDLTHIYTRLGEDYIQEFMLDPSVYHPNQGSIPYSSITEIDMDNLLIMLKWADNDTSQDNTTQSNLADEGHLIFSRLCASCHSLTPNIIIVGPSLWGVVDRTIERFPDTVPEDYIRNSILYPSDYIVEGFPDVMQKNLAEVLTSDEITLLVDFIITLRDIES